MSWHVFIGTIISQPKSQTIGLQRVISSDSRTCLYKESSSEHTEPDTRAREEFRAYGTMGLPLESGRGLVVPNVRFSRCLLGCGHAGEGEVWAEVPQDALAPTVLCLLDIQAGAWPQLAHLCVV